MTLDGERVRMHDGNAERETKGGGFKKKPTLEHGETGCQKGKTRT